ncbi:restriction endonuclease subunit S [Ectothiorhodospira shaposhnikovii]|uniref:restriction endonuclease subunit S n=1 Tax=Ectothiorhodospira shaposhnikovii TaxID=1054 RepID=UPI0039A0D2A1
MSKTIKSEKQALVPRLRFPEFQNAGEWNIEVVKSLITTVTPPKKLTSDQYENEGRFPVIDQSQDYICGWTNDENALVLVESPLIVFGDHTCVLKIIFQSFVQGADGIKILKSRGEVDPGFLYQCLLSSPVKMESYKRHFSTLKEKVIVYPDKKIGEQQKIADCFSSLDALIAAQADKIDALKTHKKGLMQQLFPREGETVPRLRFPEFRGAGEWKEEAISEIGEVVTGSTPSTTDKSLYGGDVMFVSPADISHQCFVTRTAKTLTDKGLSKARVIPARSTLFVCIGSTIGKIAQNQYECATNQQINSVIPFNKFLNDFVYYALELASERIAEMAGKQAVPIINKSLFSSILLKVPADKGEQQAVADCLSSLDALILAHTEKLDGLKTHKKGLMQQLFPIFEGMVS